MDPTLNAIVAPAAAAACVGQTSVVSTPGPTAATANEEPMEICNNETKNFLKQVLLSQRDIAGEQLLDLIIAEIITSTPKLKNYTLDERNQYLTRKTTEQLQLLSPALIVKLNPLIKTMLEKTSQSLMSHTFAQISIPFIDPITKSLIYKRMLERLICNDHCVSFAYINARLVNQMHPRDVFLLVLFSYVTCQRSRGDDMPALYISGKSSSGKSSLIEAAVSNCAHQLVTTSSRGKGAGVGRFSTFGKNVMLLRDVAVSTLVSADSDKIKTLCRGEPTVAKVHSSVENVEPIFLLVTSNERLLTHKTSQSNSIKNLPQIYPSQLMEYSTKKKIALEHVLAIQHRFLEMYIRTKPIQSDQDLQNADCFDRNHFILAVLPWIIDIYASTPLAHYPSKYLRAYVEAGINKNLPFYVSACFDDQLMQRWNEIQSREPSL